MVKAVPESKRRCDTRAQILNNARKARMSQKLSSFESYCSADSGPEPSANFSSSPFRASLALKSLEKQSVDSLKAFQAAPNLKI